MKKRKNAILIITASTMLITKLILFFVWNKEIMSPLLTDVWHHMYTGVLLMIFAKVWKNKFSFIFFSIGLGLFVDEFIHVFHLLHIINEVDYWSMPSYIATTLSFITVYIIFNKLPDSIYRKMV